MAGREDELLEQAAHYLWFADRCGWTKQQTDSQPHWLTERMPIVAEVLAEIEDEKRRRT